VRDHGEASGGGLSGCGKRRGDEEGFPGKAGMHKPHFDFEATCPRGANVRRKEPFDCAQDKPPLRSE
jgi:hypothetical protein